MVEFIQEERKVQASADGLAIKEMNQLAFKRDCAGLSAALSSAGSVENQVEALKAMSAESKGKSGLPELELILAAEKHNAVLKAGLLEKESSVWGGKLVYSMTYDPHRQSIKTWCRTEK